MLLSIDNKDRPGPTAGGPLNHPEWNRYLKLNKEKHSFSMFPRISIFFLLTYHPIPPLFPILRKLVLKMKMKMKMFIEG